MYQKIGFLGLGLIGGSIAKTIHAKYPQIQMIGMASHIETICLAHEEGVITNDAFLPLSDFGECDVVFLCAPVKANVSYLTELKKYLSPNSILTDVGSVKGDIEDAVEKLDLKASFIGGHPMAGTENTGFENATDHLLENAYYILTDNGCIDRQRYRKFSDFIASLGAIPLRISVEEHDFATAAISHLPHVISASLVNTVRNNETEEDLLKTIAAGGFRDITRISSSSPVMWQHICLTNREQILHMIDLYTKELKTFRDAIASSDESRIIELFSDAKEYRDSLPIKSSSILPKTYEFYMDLDDKAGGIAIVASILAAKNISIKNIGIIHNREYANGVLHIELYNEEDLRAAIATLKVFDYTIYEA